MNRDEAERRIETLRAFHSAVGRVYSETLTGQTHGGGTVSMGVPKPGREAEWANAKAEVELLSMKAARSFDEAGVWVEHKAPGTWQTTPVNPALLWHVTLERDTWFRPSMLEQLIQRALGRLEDLRDDPPTPASTTVASTAERRGVFIPLPTWNTMGTLGRVVASGVGIIMTGVATGGILYLLGWI